MYIYKGRSLWCKQRQLLFTSVRFYVQIKRESFWIGLFKILKYIQRKAGDKCVLCKTYKGILRIFMTKGRCFWSVIFAIHFPAVRNNKNDKDKHKTIQTEIIENDEPLILSTWLNPCSLQVHDKWDVFETITSQLLNNAFASGLTIISSSKEFTKLSH